MNLDAYRIFTDPSGCVFVAAKKDGDKVTLISHSFHKDIALEAVLADAGLKIQVQVEEIPLGGLLFEPKPEGWA